VLEGKDGYSYDKFEKTWEYIKANGAKNENNFGFIMLLALSGEKKEIRTSRVSFLLLKNIDVNKKIDDVTKIAVIADDNYITISNIYNADNIGVYLIDLSEDNIEPFKMIVDAKSVSVRVYAKSVENGYEDFEMEAEQLADLKEGMILKGTVRNVIDFGAFVDIGVKHDGLVHISEMSNNYVKNPSEIVSVGDIVKVKVIGIDNEKQKVKLSMKI